MNTTLDILRATTAEVKHWLGFEEFSGRAIKRLLHAAKVDGQHLTYGVFAKGVSYPHIERECWVKWDPKTKLFVWVSEIPRNN